MNNNNNNNFSTNNNNDSTTTTEIIPTSHTPNFIIHPFFEIWKLKSQTSGKIKRLFQRGFYSWKKYASGSSRKRILQQKYQRSILKILMKHLLKRRFWIRTNQKKLLHLFQLSKIRGENKDCSIILGIKNVLYKWMNNEENWLLIKYWNQWRLYLKRRTHWKNYLLSDESQSQPTIADDKRNLQKLIFQKWKHLSLFSSEERMSCSHTNISQEQKQKYLFLRQAIRDGNYQKLLNLLMKETDSSIDVGELLEYASLHQISNQSIYIVCTLLFFLGGVEVSIFSRSIDDMNQVSNTYIAHILCTHQKHLQQQIINRKKELQSSSMIRIWRSCTYKLLSLSFQNKKRELIVYLKNSHTTTSSDDELLIKIHDTRTYLQKLVQSKNTIQSLLGITSTSNDDGDDEEFSELLSTRHTTTSTTSINNSYIKIQDFYTKYYPHLALSQKSQDESQYERLKEAQLWFLSFLSKQAKNNEENQVLLDQLLLHTSSLPLLLERKNDINTKNSIPKMKTIWHFKELAKNNQNPKTIIDRYVQYVKQYVQASLTIQQRISMNEKGFIEEQNECDTMKTVEHLPGDTGISNSNIQAKSLEQMNILREKLIHVERMIEEKNSSGVLGKQNNNNKIIDTTENTTNTDTNNDSMTRRITSSNTMINQLDQTNLEKDDNGISAKESFYEASPKSTTTTTISENENENNEPKDKEIGDLNQLPIKENIMEKKQEILELLFQKEREQIYSHFEWQQVLKEHQFQQDLEEEDGDEIEVQDFDGYNNNSDKSSSVCSGLAKQYGKFWVRH